MKIIGILLIIAASTAMGLGAGENAARRYRVLQQVHGMLSLLAGEIRCSASEFSCAFHNLAGRCEESWIPFWQGLSDELEAFSGKSFHEIWEGAVLGVPSDCGLTEEDRRELARLGKSLGYLDAKVQQESIENFLESWQRRMEDVRGDLAPKQRMYRSLGVAFGLTVSLILL